MRYRDYGLIVTPDGRVLMRVVPHYRAGPVPCIVLRERHIAQTVLPAIIEMLDQVSADLQTNARSS